MEIFELGEMVVCPCTTKIADVLHSPDTSMKITITDPSGVAVVDEATMTEDSTGTYHYNYTPAAATGIYTVTYSAVHGTRPSKAKDHFRVRSQL